MTRKGEDKATMNIKDIIKLLKETDPSVQPAFVAGGLRLPPVTFDHVDVTRLLKDLAIMKLDLQNIRNDTVSKTEIMNLQTKISSDLTDLRTCFNKLDGDRKNNDKFQSKQAYTSR